jgi:hypothetical protein
VTRALRLAPLLVLLAACQRGADAEARARLSGKDARAATPSRARPDLSDPRPLLGLDADEAARRLGSLDWRGAVHFAANRQGEAGGRVDVSERHQVRQLATGEFTASSEIDPGAGPGGATGKEVVYTGGMTFARGRFAPFRERPTDRGRDARRFRDESFALLADVARLCGPALQLTPAGTGSHLGRTGRRFTVGLAEAPAVPARPDGRNFGNGGPDADTRRHLAFLDGRQPLAARGEVLLDEETGVLLKGQLSAAFSVRDDERLRVSVEVASEVGAIGPDVKTVAAPRDALPDARKPAGVAAALEAAGLKSREKREAAEPVDDPDVP